MWEAVSDGRPLSFEIPVAAQRAPPPFNLAVVSVFMKRSTKSGVSFLPAPNSEGVTVDRIELSGFARTTQFQQIIVRGQIFGG